MSEQDFINGQIEALRQIKIKVSNYRNTIKDSKELVSVNSAISDCMINMILSSNKANTQDVVIVNDINEIDELYYIK